MPLCGGLSDKKDITDEVKNLCDELKQKMEEKLGKKFKEFEALHFKQQLVSGMNYFVKIHVGSEECVHARIYQPFSDGVELTSIKGSMACADEIEYF
ncbi:cystatin-B-like [Octopus sinensis]|uniref:Cystatin-B-like n=1 Tax=Octopus sinensis TaxID=2607531 RepID=A0A7E6FFZ6_9MOLL|nr:cystatin-B-like [Octopus sinensis]XP_036366650.1 cystatin-B-like [Octopus sinensis]